MEINTNGWFGWFLHPSSLVVDAVVDGYISYLRWSISPWRRWREVVTAPWQSMAWQSSSPSEWTIWSGIDQLCVSNLYSESASPWREWAGRSFWCCCASISSTFDRMRYRENLNRMWWMTCRSILHGEWIEYIWKFQWEVVEISLVAARIFLRSFVGVLYVLGENIPQKFQAVWIEQFVQTSDDVPRTVDIRWWRGSQNIPWNFVRYRRWYTHRWWKRDGKTR